eukprot:5467726-Karenia_brevis.AAC.1
MQLEKPFVKTIINQMQESLNVAVQRSNRHFRKVATLEKNLAIEKTKLQDTRRKLADKGKELKNIKNTMKKYGVQVKLAIRKMEEYGNKADQVKTLTKEIKKLKVELEAANDFQMRFQWLKLKRPDIMPWLTRLMAKPPRRQSDRHGPHGSQ